jgi:hypothetical protein
MKVKRKPKLQKANLHHNTRKKYCTNVGLLKRGFCVTACRPLKKTFKGSTLSFHASIAKERLLGPYSLAPCLTGAVDHDFLYNVLSELLQDVDLLTGIHVWFMHDGAPPHLLTFRKFVNNLFPEQWVGRGGPTAWPAPSSDFSPLDFYLWEHVKSTVYATVFSDFQGLQ